MRTYVRIVFGLNAVYQLLVGIAALAVPAVIIGLYAGGPAEQQLAMLRAAFRALGANIVLGGVISALVARDPDRHPVLLPVMGVLCAVTLACWGVAWAAGEMTVAQFGLDVVVQVLLLVGVVGYARRAGRAAAPAEAAKAA